MLPVPQDVLAKFDAVLRECVVPAPFHCDYRKWLRYFLDFRGKYPLPDSRSEQARLFIYPPLILRGGGEAGGVTIKGESSNNLSRAEATTPIYPPLPDMQQPQRLLETEPAMPQ